jgi:hypothetical protein
VYGGTFKTAKASTTVIRTNDPVVSETAYTTFFDRFGLRQLRGSAWGASLEAESLSPMGHVGTIRPAFDMGNIAKFWPSASAYEQGYAV